VRLDYTIYHLDGPKAIPHLDHLLSIPELDGIQWTLGEGNPSVDSSKWFPLYRKIQKSGKRLVLLGASRKRVKPLLKILRPDGLLIRTWCPTENEARDLLDELKFLDEWKCVVKERRLSMLKVQATLKKYKCFATAIL